MTGGELWTLFLGAKIASADLRALGEDVGYLRDSAGTAAQSALLKLAIKIKNASGNATPSQIYSALKFYMPGLFSRKSLLEGLGDDYDKSKTFGTVREATRAYITSVAGKLGPLAAPPAQKTPVPASMPEQPLPTAKGSVARSKAPDTAVMTPAFATHEPATSKFDAYFLAKGVGLGALLILIFQIGRKRPKWRTA